MRVFARKSRIFRAHIEGRHGNSAHNTERTRESIEDPVFRFRLSCEPNMPKETESPTTLVAIIIAARRAGNRELEREMRRQLEQRFRVKLSFVREPNDSAKGGDR